jgi:hypothetical protein
MIFFLLEVVGKDYKPKKKQIPTIGFDPMTSGL